MSYDISELLERVYMDSTGRPEDSTAEQDEEREFLKTQILSVGFDLELDDVFQKWSLTDLRQLLDALVAFRDGETDEVAESDEGPEVTIGKHVPGVNDVVSGALPRGSASMPAHRDLGADDDSTVCRDTLPRLYFAMPHYMISVKVLRTMNLFSNPDICDLFPSDFYTTIKGLKRAWDEANARQPDAADDMDDYLFETVLKRGGVIKDSYWSVKYPADIIAQNGEDADPEFWQEIREMDLNEDEEIEREERANRRFGT